MSWKSDIQAIDSAGSRLIKQIADVPKGRYQPFVEEFVPLKDYSGDLALLRAGSTGMMFHALISEEIEQNDKLDIINKIKAVYPQSNVKVIKATKDIIGSLHKRNSDSEAIDQSQIQKRVDQIIDLAIAENASDIHIETRTDHAVVMLRINKHRYAIDETLSIDTARSIARVMYQRGDASSKDTDWSDKEIRDTSFDYVCANGETLQVRFHSAPIAPFGNFQIVCRLLYLKRVPNINEIGYTKAQIEAIRRMTFGSQGLILFVGPTNSGKSTSMRSVIEEVRKERGESAKIVTVEDPVEYLIDGACQMGVSSGRKSLADTAGSVYGGYLKATLRQDPDVVMLGEVRDEETASIISRLTQAGHKVLTTLHAGCAITAFYRLKEIGMKPDVLFTPGSISGVVYQRLVPTLCPHCAIPWRDAREAGRVDEYMQNTMEQFFDDERDNVHFHNPNGCEHCKQRGISGMTICAEIIVPDAEFLRLMRDGQVNEAIEYWQRDENLIVSDRGVRAVHHGMMKVSQGLIDPYHLREHVGDFS